jgi:GNAT superfamily N-acetyltransferase
VATATAFLFGSIAWLATVLVDKDFRGRGIGTQLVEHALAYLDRSGIQTVRLDATDQGRPIYQRLGFVTDYELVRFEGGPVSQSRGKAVTPVTQDQLEAVVALDRQITGTDRRRLIERLFLERPDRAALVVEDEMVVGHTMLRPGCRATQVGPAAATAQEAGRRLLQWALTHCDQNRVFVDIPGDNRSATDWAFGRGFVVQRRFVRMYRGQPVRDRPDQIWATSGPEKG